ncbi:MAG: P-loop NTPase fold protein, partial [Candidatus Gastranaerophilaceae bacterium]
MGILCKSKKKTENRIVFPSILDREIENKENDRFGHIHFAEILYSLIKNNDAPFSIGLLGKWGVGKSSIKKLCEFAEKVKKVFKINNIKKI